MCLAIPGKIIELSEKNGVKMSKVDFGGITREACLEYVPEARIGEYVMVHVGFAISKVDEEEAAELTSTWPRWMRSRRSMSPARRQTAVRVRHEVCR